MIDDPDFISQHMNHSTKTNTNKSLFFKEVFSGNLYDLDLDSLHPCGPIQYRDLPEELSDRYKLVVGLCNGLLCNKSLRDNEFLIHNPSTRKHYSFPSFFPSNCTRQEGIGFGYDSVMCDYMIAMIVLVEPLGIFQSQIFIGNVRTKSCIVIQLPYLVTREIDYWVFFARNVLMGLDLVTEEFQQVPRNESDDIDMYIGVLETWLCVFVHDFKAGKPEIDVWVMKDYEAQESWTKLFTIPYDVLSGNNCQIAASLGISKTGLEVLLEVDCSRLVWYEIEGKKAVDITVQGFKNTPFVTLICLRSLVPLDASVVGFDEDEPSNQRRMISCRWDSSSNCSKKDENSIKDVQQMVLYDDDDVIVNLQ
ncbi:F-box protein CPR1-like [Mercurialis annua]|uniref:F-box protein CPR1-like n=1 Tax=Mercurialis annua TaxID=3986 RepID=UPI00215E7D96|nr:F-box protein CPR1-like [Mercurialis annua]